MRTSLPCLALTLHPASNPPAPPQVVREAYPDLTAQVKSGKYYDPKATPEDPRWSMVDFKLVSPCAVGGCMLQGTFGTEHPHVAVCLSWHLHAIFNCV